METAPAPVPLPASEPALSSIAPASSDGATTYPSEASHAQTAGLTAKQRKAAAAREQVELDRRNALAKRQGASAEGSFSGVVPEVSAAGAGPALDEVEEVEMPDAERGANSGDRLPPSMRNPPVGL